MRIKPINREKTSEFSNSISAITSGLLRSMQNLYKAQTPGFERIGRKLSYVSPLIYASVSDASKPSIVGMSLKITMKIFNVNGDHSEWFAP